MTTTVPGTLTTPTVAEVMRRAVSVHDDMPFRDLATILSGGRVTAVPVVDRSGTLLGVVTEVDIMRAGLRDMSRLGGLTARELMTSPVATVSAGEPVRDAARRLAGVRVRRLFVVEHGRLVGVLSRRDLPRSYLREDEDIRTEVERTVRAALPENHTIVNVSVTGGTVLLAGRVEWRSALAGIDALVCAIPGVVEVRNRIGYQWDDVGGRAR